MARPRMCSRRSKACTKAPRAPRVNGAIWCAALRRIAGPWPRVSVWHGNADKTVIPSNAREILKQWTAVHGLADRAVRQGHGRRLSARGLAQCSGQELIESYSITGMAHGTPLATGEAEGACGAAGPFLLQGRDFVVLSHREILRPHGRGRCEAGAERDPASLAGRAAPRSGGAARRSGRRNR